jgi:hypothetical protein
VSKPPGPAANAECEGGSVTGVSVRERVMKGGGWVKRPAGAKGFESRRKCLGVLATVQCDKGVKNPPAEEVGLNLLICM